MCRLGRNRISAGRGSQIGAAGGRHMAREWKKKGQQEQKNRHEKLVKRVLFLQDNPAISLTCYILVQSGQGHQDDRANNRSNNS